MRGKIDGLQVSFLDAKELMVDAHTDSLISEQERCKLYGYGEVDCWRLPPRFLLCMHGVFIDVDEVTGKRLTKEEHQERLSCPSGDLLAPIVTFPCTLRELKECLESADAAELIYPFDMAEWVGRNLGSSQAAPQQDDADDIRSLEAFGLLLETFSQLSNKYKYGNNPNQSVIAEKMLKVVPDDVTKMKKRTLQERLSQALDAWEAKKRR